MRQPWILDLIHAVQDGARKATKYISPTMTSRATARFKPDKRSKRTEILVTYGRPNFAERQFIKACKKAGEPFPVKKIQIREWPKKKR